MSLDSEDEKALAVLGYIVGWVCITILLCYQIKANRERYMVDNTQCRWVNHEYYTRCENGR